MQTQAFVRIKGFTVRFLGCSKNETTYYFGIFDEEVFNNLFIKAINLKIFWPSCLAMLEHVQAYFFNFVWSESNQKFICRKMRRNMLCIVYAVHLRWTKISKTSYALKNTVRKTSWKPTMTSYFIQKTKLRLPKVDLAIARKLPKLRRYRNVFSREKRAISFWKKPFWKENFVNY